LWVARFLISPPLGKLVREVKSLTYLFAVMELKSKSGLKNPKNLHNICAQGFNFSRAF